MPEIKTPESIADEASDHVRRLIGEAYDAGYAAGSAAVADRIMQAALAAGSTVKPAPAVSASEAAEQQPALKRRRTAHWNSSDVRPFPYGAVSNAFREALRQAPEAGLSKDEFFEAAGKVLNADMATVKYRDTFKRLKESDEMRVVNGRFYAGAGLIGAQHVQQETPEAKPPGLFAGPHGGGTGFPSSAPEGSTPSGSTFAPSSQEGGESREATTTHH